MLINHYYVRKFTANENIFPTPFAQELREMTSADFQSIANN